jgi:hypothetical protein
MNDMSFLYGKRTLEEIKSLFLKTLYLWTLAFVSPLVISYHDFLVFLLLLVRWLLLYILCISRAPYAFNDISIIYRKKKSFILEYGGSLSYLGLLWLSLSRYMVI